MKKLFMIGLWTLFCSPLFSQNYDAVANYYDTLAEILTDYADALETAETIKDVEKALAEYMETLERLKPLEKKLEKEFPLLNDPSSYDEDFPEELLAAAQRLETASTRITASTMALMKFSQNPDFPKIMAAFSAAMEKSSEAN